jgi:hypothetical protein
MTPELVQLLTALGELLSQGTVVGVLGGMLMLSLWVNLLQYRAKDGLYDRLIEAESRRADAAEKNTTALVTEMSQVRLVLMDLRDEAEAAENLLPGGDHVPALLPETPEDGEA